MTNFTLGRIGLAVDMDDVSQWDMDGPRVSVAFSTPIGSLAEANAIRQQLLGYVDRADEDIVPVTWTDDVQVNGFYRVLAASVTPDPDLAFDGLYYFTASLLRMQGYATPLQEATIVHQDRVQSVAAVPLGRIAVPDAATSLVMYEPDADLFDSPTVTTAPSESGTVRMVPIAGYESPVIAQYSVTPDHYYDGAATLFVGGKVVVGRQVTNLTDDWQLNNGLLRVTPDFAGGTLKLVLASFISAAWEADQTFTVRGSDLNPLARVDLASPDSLTVLRNTPEEVSIRLVSQYTTGAKPPIYLDITMRRGDRFVACRLSFGLTSGTFFASLRNTAFGVAFGAAQIPGAWLTPGTYARTNFATNPAAGLNTTGWSVLAGTATGRQTGTGPITNITSWYRATASAAHAGASFGIRSGSAVTDNAVVPGRLISVSAYVRCSVSRNLQMRYSFYNASNVLIGSATTVAAFAVTANVWSRPTVVANITTPALTAMMRVEVIGDATAWAAGQTLDMTGISIEDGAGVSTYMDGSRPWSGSTGYAWNGDIHGSATSQWTLNSDPHLMIASPKRLNLLADEVSPNFGDTRWDFALGSDGTSNARLDQMLGDYMHAVAAQIAVVSQ